MFPGMNPREMKKIMKRMGIKQEEIDAEVVIIRLKDKEIIINNPSVSKVNMMGEETYQITGEEEVRDIETEVEINEDDIKTVMEQANVSREEAISAIKENNYDLAQTIISFQNKNNED